MFSEVYDRIVEFQYTCMKFEKKIIIVTLATEQCSTYHLFKMVAFSLKGSIVTASVVDHYEPGSIGIFIGNDLPTLS